MTGVTAGELLRRALVAAGVDRVYGERFGKLGVTPVPAAVAGTFASAHQRVHGVRAAFHLGDGIFRLPALEPGERQVPVVDRAPGDRAPVDRAPGDRAPGDRAPGDRAPGDRTVGDGTVFDRAVVDRAEEMVEVLRALRASSEVELIVRIEPDELVPDIVPPPAPTGEDERWLEPSDEAVDMLRSARSAAVLAGPGVICRAEVPALHDLAVAAGVGVLNTWGAKGVFDWRSRHHLATVGLQERDFELGGLADHDLIIATGLDPLESPDGHWDLAPAVRVVPGALARLAEQCGETRRSPAMPPLRRLLAEVTQRGWEVAGAPLPPSRVTMHYSRCLGAGGLVAADAGTAGFWVARTFGTTRIGGAVVPSAPSRGFAAACVAVARMRSPARGALAVVDSPVDSETVAVAEAAASLGVKVPIEAWGPDGEELEAETHLLRLQRMMSADSASAGDEGSSSRVPGWPCTLATDPGQLSEMVAVAGPIVAWTGA